MDKVILSLLIEAFLKSAIEGTGIMRSMDAEGRTHLTPEEEAKLREATDVAEQVAKAKGERL